MDKIKKYDKNDPRVRYALWRAYGYKDYYTKKKLKFAELEIDHIIPKSLKDDPVKYERYLKLLGLDKNFELDSILNYVPTSKYINREKSNYLLPPNLASIMLRNARKKAEKINRLIELFDKNIKISELITRMKNTVKNNDEFEHIYDILIDDTDEFENRKYISNDVICKHYQFSIKRICLTAFLPSYGESEPSCLIAFRTLTLRDCKITLDKEQIIRYLFKGVKTNPKFLLRGFIISNSTDGKYYVHLGDNYFILNKNETNELCHIVDDFFNYYINSLIEVEKNFGSIKFRKTKNGAYKLLRISINLWKQIVDFMLLNDAFITNNEWSIFDPNEFVIKVYTKDHPKYENGYHAIINLEPDYNNYFLNYYNQNIYVWLVWEPWFTFNNENDIGNVSDKKYWSPNKVYQWLTEELIPRVIFENNKRKNYIGKNSPDYYNFIKTFDINNYISTDLINFININEITNVNKLLKVTEYIQNFYSSYETVFLKKEEISDIYKALLIVLNNSKIEYIPYISSNLGFTKANSYEELIKDVTEYIKKIEDSIVGTFVIDTTLRCMLVCLRNYNCQLSTKQIQEVCNCLEPLIKIYNTDKLLKK